MTPQELQLRMKFPEEQANRLLNANPLVAEFYYHFTQIELMKQQLQGQAPTGYEGRQEPQTVDANRVPLNGSA